MSAFTRNKALLDWLKEMDEHTLSAIGVSPSYLRLIAYGHKRPSAKAAALIELATRGTVTRQSLRPDDWHLIWPELNTPRHETA